MAFLPAQCANTWRPESALMGTDGDVNVTKMWDPDGPGPAGSVVVVGGYFTHAGTTLAYCLAMWDPATGIWSALGPILDGVSALAVLPNGELVAAGALTQASGGMHNHIVRWNGTSWSDLGSGTNGGISSLVVQPNGDLVAGGAFTSASGVPAGGIARWDGTTWSSLGSGTNGWVTSLALLANGDLVAGGYFTTAGGVAAASIARWNGTAWSSLGSGTDGW